MNTLRFLFLGPAEVYHGNHRVELRAAKAIGLLAYLAVTGNPQTRDHLADLLWPDSLPDAARKNLRNTLWAIRRVFGEDVLSQTDADRIVISDEIWVDVLNFEATAYSLSAAEMTNRDNLRAAIELYRAPFLDGFMLSHAPGFEIWLTGERERFGQLYLRLQEALIRAHRTRGDWSAVIASAQESLAHDNLREPMYRALMEAHARLGERPEALRQYDRLQTTLSNELGVRPLPETEALREAILSGSLRPVESSLSLVPPLLRSAPEMERQPQLPFVGRQAELIAIDQELQRSSTGQARVVLITGELGIGKSQLWQKWSAAQPPDRVVLKTRCLDTTQSLPFAPLIDVFGRQSCFERLFKPPSPISLIWLAELARLLPEIRQHWPEMPAPVALPPEEERRRLFEALTQALRVLEDRPLVLFIDDLHWVDHATLDWLIYLVNRMRDEPLLLVCAYRSDEATTQLVSGVAGWNREGITRLLPLDRLSYEESTKLVAAIGGDVASTEQLLTESAGNPYFLIELGRVAPDVTPPGLAEMVRTRLDRLPDINRQVLQAAAVLEAGFEFATLRRTGGRGEEETLDALDALLGAHVLTERQGRFEFAHPLVATVIRRDLSIPRRSFLHRRAAEAMEAIYMGRLELIAGQLATHYSQSGRQAQAAHYAELAAKRALDLTAPAEAVAFYQQALSLEPTLARRMGLGQALYVQGDLESARETFCSALAGFEAQGDVAGAVRACLALAETYLPSGQADKVIDWAELALPNLDAGFDPESHARVHYLLGAGGLMSGVSLSAAEAHLNEASSLATSNNLSEMAARSQFELGNLLAQRGDLERALEAFENAISLAQTAGHHFLEMLGHNNLAYHAQLAGDLATAREHIELGLSLAEAHDLLIPRQYLYSTRGEIALAEGHFDEAEEWFARGLREAEGQANNLQVANIRANLGLVAQARGDLDRALMLLETACTTVSAISAPPQHLQIQIDLWLANLHLRRVERAAAGEALSRAETRLVESERQGLQECAKKLRSELQP